MYEAWCTCKVVVKSIAFLRPQPGFPNMLLKNMNIHEHWTRELRVSNPNEFPFTTNMTDCQVYAAMWQCVEVCSIRVRWSETLIDQQGVENTSHRPFNKEGKTETRRKNLSEQTSFTECWIRIGDANQGHSHIKVKRVTIYICKRWVRRLCDVIEGDHSLRTHKHMAFCWLFCFILSRWKLVRATLNVSPTENESTLKKQMRNWNYSWPFHSRGG